MNVLHVAASDGAGGAARGGYRIHRALAEQGANDNVHSSMRVCNKTTDDASVTGGDACVQGFVRRTLRPRLTHLAMRGFSTGSDAFHSVAWPATGLGRILSRGPAELLHLQWLGRHTLSVEEIGALRQPIVWTLHDMWTMCGAEHYSDDERYVHGYHADNRPAFETGRDVNAWTWRRKRRAWRRAMHLVAPSRWIADCARRGQLTREWPVTVIPNPLDLQVFRPVAQAEARRILGMPIGVPLVLFGALGGTTDRRKGADLLRDALAVLRARTSDGALRDLRLVIFGQDQPERPLEAGFPVHYAGVLTDDSELCNLYAAADVMVVPSRLDNLPQTATEAMACGTPVVAFKVGGLPDIVEHQRTGYLAEPRDPASLAAGIEWVLTNAARRLALGAAARDFAERRWSPAVVARQYLAVYQDVLHRAFHD